MSGNRVLVTTILGFIFGIIAYLLVRGTEGMTCGIAWSIILDGALLGFIIGISVFKFNFVVHGIVMGAIVYFPAALPSGKFLRYWVAGMIYGALIEIISHIIIKEKTTQTSAS
ncbi:MAG: hypothetical protein V1890_06510 [Candidatus Zixiibacteriota bacterium]